MSQINVNPSPAQPSQQPVAVAPVAMYDDSSGARTAASSNLTWAIAMVVIIAAIAIAVVYVFHNVVH